MVCIEDTSSNKHIFWDKVNIQKIRKSNEKARLGYLMAQYGISFLESGRRTTVSGHGGPNKKQKTTEDRKKRSVGKVVEQNVTTHSISIVDADSISDFKLKDCRIWE